MGRAGLPVLVLGVLAIGALLHTVTGEQAPAPRDEGFGAVELADGLRLVRHMPENGIDPQLLRDYVSATGDRGPALVPLRPRAAGPPIALDKQYVTSTFTVEYLAAPLIFYTGPDAVAHVILYSLELGRWMTEQEFSWEYDAVVSEFSIEAPEGDYYPYLFVDGNGDGQPRGTGDFWWWNLLTFPVHGSPRMGRMVGIRTPVSSWEIYELPSCDSDDGAPQPGPTYMVWEPFPEAHAVDEVVAWTYHEDCATGVFVDDSWSVDRELTTTVLDLRPDCTASVGVDIIGGGSSAHPSDFIGLTFTSFTVDGETFYGQGGRLRTADDPRVEVDWVDVGVGAAGQFDSRWRTDLVVLNTGLTTASLDIRFNSSESLFQLQTLLEPGAQGAIEDLVAQMGLEGKGSVEVRSDQPLEVAARVYNTGDSGTFGQFFDGSSLGDALGDHEYAWLLGLRQEEGRFRTNIGLTNISNDDATVEVELHESGGELLKVYTLSVPSGSLVQDLEPFARRAGRTMLGWGFAKVAVVSGHGILATASVVDSRTNDATTVTMTDPTRSTTAKSRSAPSVRSVTPFTADGSGRLNSVPRQGSLPKSSHPDKTHGQQTSSMFLEYVGAPLAEFVGQHPVMDCELRKDVDGSWEAVADVASTWDSGSSSVHAEGPPGLYNLSCRVDATGDQDPLGAFDFFSTEGTFTLPGDTTVRFARMVPMLFPISSFDENPDPECGNASAVHIPPGRTEVVWAPFPEESLLERMTISTTQWDCATGETLRSEIKQLDPGATSLEVDLEDNARVAIGIRFYGATSVYGIETLLGEVYSKWIWSGGAVATPQSVAFLTSSDAQARHSAWVDVGVGAPGQFDSQWQTDVAVRNLGTEPAALELLLHSSEGTLSMESQVAVGAQAVFEDLVSLMGYEGKGSLELVANQPVAAVARVYNDTGSGSFGQSFPGRTTTDSLFTGQSGWLLGLRQLEGVFRTNLGFTNSGQMSARLRVSLFAQGGSLLHEYELELAPGELYQDLEPLASRAGTPDIGWAYVLVDVRYGVGVLASASVIDSRTNDATTVPIRRRPPTGSAR